MSKYDIVLYIYTLYRYWYTFSLFNFTNYLYLFYELTRLICQAKESVCLFSSIGLTHLLRRKSMRSVS